MRHMPTGRLLLVLRLAGRDLRRRPAEALMVLLVIAAATTTLTIGLALRGVTDHPFAQTKAATAGPDVIAGFLREDGAAVPRAEVDQIARAPGVTATSGPFPLVHTLLRAGGRTLTVEALGRDPAAAAVDQPKIMQGDWVRPGQVVLERGFADALGAHVGDQVTLGGRSLRVGGVAVGSALPAYPSSLCHIYCFAGVPPGGNNFDIGLVWLDGADLATLTERSTPLVVYLMNLRLADPAAATAFAAAHGVAPGPGAAGPFLLPWTAIQDADSGVMRSEQAALQVGGALLALLAVAGLAVLAGRRMVEQTRRIGLLKAVGGTPGLVAGVLLAQHLLLAVLAAALGLTAGRLLGGRFTGPGAGLIGAPGTPALTATTVAVVAGAALAVAIAATVAPALRAARTSTIRALADAPRTPRRSPRLIALSARLPVPLMLGLRLAGRRPGRTALSVLSVAVTVTGLVTILTSDTVTGRYAAGVHNLRADRLHDVTLIITVMLVVLAAVNTVFTTWATVADAGHAAAVARAFGATPRQVSAGLSAAQVAPAALGAAAGLPAGVLVYQAVTQQQPALPPPWQLAGVLAAALFAVAACAAVPARFGARRPVAAVLSAEAG